VTVAPSTTSVKVPAIGIGERLVAAFLSPREPAE
jgi:hypothetical protein